MGIVTSAYFVNKEALDLFLGDSNNIGVIVYPSEKNPRDIGLDVDWKPKRVHFDKKWDDLIILLRGTEYSKLAYIINDQVKSMAYKYSDFYVRYIREEPVKNLAKELANVSKQQITQIC